LRYVTKENYIRLLIDEHFNCNQPTPDWLTDESGSDADITPTAIVIIETDLINMTQLLKIQDYSNIGLIRILTI